MSLINNKQPLYILIANEIKKRILEGIYCKGSKLASEPELAEEFGVSRGTLREALGLLEKEGLIFRKHGVGSFVKGIQPKVVAGIESLDSLVLTIRNAGFTARDEVLKIYRHFISREIAPKLEVDPYSEAYVIESLKYADEEPVIYCYDILPGWIIQNSSIIKNRIKTECLVDFLTSYTGVLAGNYVSTVSAVMPKKPVNTLLKADKRTPLILMEGIMYDVFNKPVNWGRQYFRSDKYQFHLVRKTTGSKG